MKVTTIDSDGKKVSEVVSTEQQNSIEITSNAKGEKAWKVKVYCDDPVKMGLELEIYIQIAKNTKG